MAKRIVNTFFWDDSYIDELEPIEKLLFLYLLTNRATNMLGIYELKLKQISLDTGIDKNVITEIFIKFHADNKATYLENYVCLHNFTKHQSYNTNMKKSALEDFKNLPLSVKNANFTEPILKGLEPFPKGYERVRNPLQIGEEDREYEYEKEYDREGEREYDGEFGNPLLTRPPGCSLEAVKEYCDEAGIDPALGKRFFQYYENAEWKVKGSALKNWKKKLSKWATDEHNQKRLKEEFVPPELEEIIAHCEQDNIPAATGKKFYLHFESVDWMIGGQRLLKWKARLASWHAEDLEKGTSPGSAKGSGNQRKAVNPQRILDQTKKLFANN